MYKVSLSWWHYIKSIYLFTAIIPGIFFIFSLTSCFHLERPSFTWPVEAPYTLSRRYSIYHEGIDFPKRTGESVFAVADGKVIYAGTQISGYGKVIIIEHDYNWASLYAHLSKMNIKAGSIVRKNQKIGEVGSTGRSSAPHLHFELMLNKQVVNPTRFLP